MAIRHTTLIIKNNTVPNAPFSGATLLKGEPIVNTADGILMFSGITSSTSEWTPAGTGVNANFFEVGSNLNNLKIRNKIISYSGVTNLSGKFLSGTTSGFVLADINSIQGFDRYVTGSTLNSSTNNSNLQSSQLSYNLTPSGGPYYIDTENTYTTGGTYDNNTTLITFDRNDGVSYTVDLSGVNNTYVTAYTYTASANTLTIYQNQGESPLSVLIDEMSGLTANTIYTDYINFNTGATQNGAVGKLNWNDDDGTLDLGLKGGNITLQIGQEEVIRIINKTSSNLLESEYKVVRVRTQSEGGAQGQRLAVVLAQANTKANHSGVLGLVTENITKNQEGFITTFGNVRGINTTGSLQGETWLGGDVLWLSETNAGGLTNIEPQNHPVQIGYVVYAHNNNGKIFVRVEDGVDELSELHDVQITGTTKGGSSLTYNVSTGIWGDKPITWTVELIDALTVDIYAPYNLSIDTIINVLNSPSITIQDDGMSYTLGNPIDIGSKITITASSIGVINLIINKL